MDCECRVKIVALGLSFYVTWLIRDGLIRVLGLAECVCGIAEQN